MLISKAAGSEVRGYVDRTLGSLDEGLRTRLTEASNIANERIGLPATLLATNWTVDPFGRRRLYDMLEKVEAKAIKRQKRFDAKRIEANTITREKKRTTPI